MNIKLKKQTGYLISILTLTVLLSLYVSELRPVTMPKIKHNNTALQTFSFVKSVEYIEEIKFRGSVSADKSSYLSLMPSGKIESILVSAGDFVKEGDALLFLNSGTLLNKKENINYQIKSLTAQLSYKKQLFIKSQRLSTKAAITSDSLEKVKASYLSLKYKIQALKSDLKEIKRAINELTLRAPYDGQIISVIADEAAISSPEKPLIYIVSKSGFSLDIDLPEKHLSLMSKGMTVYAVEKNRWYYDITGEEFQVDAISYQADPITNLFRVKLKSKSSTSNLRQGQLVEVSVPAKRIAALSIPAQAVLNHSSAFPFVYVKRADSRIDRVDIKIIDYQNGDAIFISDKIKAGNEIAVSGQLHLFED